MGSGFYVVRCHHDGAVVMLSQYVEILQQRGTVAINVENAASNTSRGPITLTKPAFGKIQLNSILFVCDNRNEIVEVSISLPLEELGIGDLGQVIWMKCSSAPQEEPLRKPCISRGVAEERRTCNHSQRNFAIRLGRCNLGCVDERPI